MVEKYTLSNGIPLFVVENHTSPVVSIQAWVRRGSAHEQDHQAGISHFIEHALFKGTKKRSVGAIAGEIEARGGEINAFTSFEETVYYTTLASRYFEDGLDVIADAIQNPLFDKQEMDREREVILEEIKRAEDSASKVLFTNLLKASFKGTSYGRPVLGYVDTVGNFSNKFLKSYFDKHYNANTISLFIVGDINTRKCQSLVKTKFRRMKKARAVKLKPPVIKPVRTPMISLSEKDISECHLHISRQGFPMSHENIPALDLALSALGEGESSRLYQRLVKKEKIALDADVSLIATRHCGLAGISGTVAPDQVEPFIEATNQLLNEVAEGGLFDEEIERVKTSMEAEATYGKETVEGHAKRLGHYYVYFGDPNYECKFLDTILAVTREQAQEALRILLTRKPILSMVHPKGIQFDRQRLKRLIHPSPPVAKKSPVPMGEATLTQRNAMRFVLKRVNHLPTVSLRMTFLGGTREEALSHHGLGVLFQRVWSSGTPSYTALEIAKELERIGAGIHTYCGKNTCGMSVEFLSKHWKTVKPLAKEILGHPTFPQEEFDTEKAILLREIQAQHDTPARLCQLNFMKGLYGDHPYGRSGLGTKEAVEALQPQDLVNFHKAFIHKKNAVVASVGDFPSSDWIEEILDISGEIADLGKAPHATFPIPKPTSPTWITATKQPLSQSHLLVGFLGPTLEHSERFALKVLTSILEGQGGRLFLELRDKQSLAYTVAPFLSEAPEPGILGFYIACSPEKLTRALHGIRCEIDKILNKPVAKTELERAKRYWIGHHELAMQRFNMQTLVYATDEIYGLGYQHSSQLPKKIHSITATDIQKAAQKYFTMATPTVSVVHPTPIDAETLAQAWQG